MTRHGDTEELLARELTHGARQFDHRGGHELSVDQVLGKARSIRRRRRTAAGLAVAAVVLAAVAPTALLRDHDTQGSPLPMGPVHVDRLSFRDLPTGAEPATGWVEGDTWHGPDGSTRALDVVQDPVFAAAPVGDLLVVAASTGNSETGAVILPDGGVRDLGKVTGAPVRSAGGGVAAVVAPDGSVTAVQDEDGFTATELPRVSVETPLAAAVVGEDCRDGVPEAGCTVFVKDAGRKPTTWGSSSRGGVQQWPWAYLDAMSAQGRSAVMTSIDEMEPGSCSRVQDAAGEEVWDTCAASFLAFSPSGERLLGSSPYRDGFGMGELMVYDARDGAQQLHLHAVDQATIVDMVWEDDAHLLALLFERNRWGVIRVGVDGTAELAVPPVRGTTDDAPLALPAG